MDKCKVTVGQIKPNMMSSFWDGWWWQVIRKHPKVAAINLDCWGASFDISFFNLLFFSPFYFLIWHYVHLALLVSLTCVSLSQKVSFEWCYSVCCPLFSVLSNHSWSRRMATHPESGSARGFFLLKGSRFIPQSPHAHSWNWTQETFWCNLLVSLARKLFLNWFFMYELD